MNNKFYVLILLATGIVGSCQDPQNLNNLAGTVWYTEFYGETDSLRFYENNVSEYYLTENIWWAPCTYLPKDDTLYLLSKRTSDRIELKDFPDPEIVQKLILHRDTMTMIYQALYRGESMSVSAPKDFHFIKVKKKWWWKYFGED